MNRTIQFFFTILTILSFSCSAESPATPLAEVQNTPRGGSLATFAGGCFWCMEPPFEKLTGVLDVTSGYTGGQESNPTYGDVSAGRTGHTEAVQIRYNPAVIGYDQLLDVFWKSMDPTDSSGQFADQGSQYRPEIFVHNAAQKKRAEYSKKKLADSGVFAKKIVVPITDYQKFYAAEDYHQDYYLKNEAHYKAYRKGSGREAFLTGQWGDSLNKPPLAQHSKFIKPSMQDLRETLTPIQFSVTQENATESPFANEYWDNKKEGIYVDIISGEALFSSKDKFKSGTGWPSFTDSLEADNIHQLKDQSLGVVRVELRSNDSDSHLGHLFTDGPKPTGLRYCINSASLRFIQTSDLIAEGYGQYKSTF